METALTILYAVIVLSASATMLSLEYYARKAKVVAAPSVPWMRKAVVARLKKEVEGSGNPAPLILELGSGWGTLALDAAKACPSATIIGYEISPIPLFFSRLRAALRGYKHTKFLSADLFAEDFSKADIVLTYLTMPHMERLRPKFEAELKPGAIVICNTFPVPGWAPNEEEMIQNFVYTLKVFTFRMPPIVKTVG
jgi:ubiquinone/menaquinone biosynthesis C-methylase UbiE